MNISDKQVQGYNSIIFLLVIISYIVALVAITISIILSPWFNIFNNALSDLGHSVKSRVAPIFNLGLVLSGYIIFYLAVVVMSQYDRIRAYILMYSALMLTLVAVFDEVYGRLHVIVSILFFTSLILYLFYISVKERILLASITGIVHIILWSIYLIYRMPRGAAIPEILAILTFIPFYTRDYIVILKKLVNRE